MYKWGVSIISNSTSNNNVYYNKYKKIKREGKMRMIYTENLEETRKKLQEYNVIFELIEARYNLKYGKRVIDENYKKTIAIACSIQGLYQYIIQHNLKSKLLKESAKTDYTYFLYIVKEELIDGIMVRDYIDVFRPIEDELQKRLLKAQKELLDYEKMITSLIHKTTKGTENEKEALSLLSEYIYSVNVIFGLISEIDNKLHTISEQEIEQIEKRKE